MILTLLSDSNGVYSAVKWGISWNTLKIRNNYNYSPDVSQGCVIIYADLRHFILSPQGEGVRDHGDAFRICGLVLDIAHGVAEILLQDLDVAPVPRHLDGVADFQG